VGKFIMAMMFIAIFVAVVFVIGWLGRAVLAYLSNRSKVSRQDLDDTEARLYASERVLRQIAYDGVGDPRLEAQLYFEENDILKTKRKEIR
jgi:hypothetical protein